MSERVVVVGGGISGLVAALELERAGREVVLLEKEQEIGGRVRSSTVHGYTIDHGFQVLFTAYPVLTSYLDLEALQLRDFLPGARIVGPGEQGGDDASLIGDAIRNPALLLPTLAARHVSLVDKLRILGLRSLATSLSVEECFSARYQALGARELLAQRGLAGSVVERFFAPFYGGIFLDRTLTTSASMLLFTFKMLAEGRTTVPAAGIGAISAQLASRLAPTTVRTDAAVVALDIVDDGVRGVRLESGEELAASDVVLATESPVTGSLAATAGVHIATPRGALRCATVYFASREVPLPGRALWLNADRNAVVSHAVTMTEVAPEYAPAGHHLLAATAVGRAAEHEDRTLADGALKELKRLRGSSLPDLELVAIVRVAYAQYPQPPHFIAHRPSVETTVRGLWVGGEAVHSSSLEGAARGGRDAARAVLAARGERRTDDGALGAAPSPLTASGDQSRGQPG